MKLATDKTFRYGLGYSCYLSFAAGFVALLPFVGLGLLIAGVVLLDAVKMTSMPFPVSARAGGLVLSGRLVRMLAGRYQGRS